MKYVNPDPPTTFEWRLLELWAILGYVLSGDCGFHCHNHETYGFVPEACCPIHDSERWWHKPLIKVLVLLPGIKGSDVAKGRVFSELP